jgi:hypothetical protein
VHHRLAPLRGRREHDIEQEAVQASGKVRVAENARGDAAGVGRASLDAAAAAAVQLVRKHGVRQLGAAVRACSAHVHQ